MQVSPKLRKATTGHVHWCPGCGESHMIPNSWGFDGNVALPTFSPSVRITGHKTVKDERGEWTGEWVKDAEGKPIPDCCHYNLTAGKLLFHGDSTHPLSGQTVDLPDLPDWLQDAAE